MDKAAQNGPRHEKTQYSCRLQTDIPDNKFCPIYKENPHGNI